MLRCYTATGSKMQETTYSRSIQNDTVLFQDLPEKKRNSTSTQHNCLFSGIENVKINYQRQLFCLFEADEATTKAANTNCFTN